MPNGNALTRLRAVTRAREREPIDDGQMRTRTTPKQHCRATVELLSTLERRRRPVRIVWSAAARRYRELLYITVCGHPDVDALTHPHLRKEKKRRIKNRNKINNVGGGGLSHRT